MGVTTDALNSRGRTPGRVIGWKKPRVLPRAGDRLQAWWNDLDRVNSKHVARTGLCSWSSIALLCRGPELAAQTVPLHVCLSF